MLDEKKSTVEVVRTRIYLYVHFNLHGPKKVTRFTEVFFIRYNIMQLLWMPAIYIAGSYMCALNRVHVQVYMRDTSTTYMQQFCANCISLLLLFFYNYRTMGGFPFFPFHVLQKKSF